MGTCESFPIVFSRSIIAGAPRWLDALNTTAATLTSCSRAAISSSSLLTRSSYDFRDSSTRRALPSNLAVRASSSFCLTSDLFFFQTRPYKMLQNHQIISKSHRIVSYRIVSYRIVSYRIISYHVISYHIIIYHIISRPIISYHVVSYVDLNSASQLLLLIYHIISYPIITLIFFC